MLTLVNRKEKELSVYEQYCQSDKSEQLIKRIVGCIKQWNKLNPGLELVMIVLPRDDMVERKKALDEISAGLMMRM